MSRYWPGESISTGQLLPQQSQSIDKAQLLTKMMSQNRLFWTVMYFISDPYMTLLLLVLDKIFISSFAKIPFDYFNETQPISQFNQY